MCSATWRTVELSVSSFHCHADAFRDALQTITEVATVNAIYLDAFSPDQNSELWSAPFIGRLAERLEPGGRLTTYCVQRKVRERLSSAGLKVEKMRGPNGGKREILVAEQPYSR